MPVMTKDMEYKNEDGMISRGGTFCERALL